MIEYDGLKERFFSHTLDQTAHIDWLGYLVFIEDGKPHPIFGVKASSEGSDAVLTWRTV